MNDVWRIGFLVDIDPPRVERVPMDVKPFAQRSGDPMPVIQASTGLGGLISVI